MDDKPVWLMSKEPRAENLTTVEAAETCSKTPWHALPAMATVCALLWQALSSRFAERLSQGGEVAASQKFRGLHLLFLFSLWLFLGVLCFPWVLHDHTLKAVRAVIRYPPEVCWGVS